MHKARQLKMVQLGSTLTGKLIRESDPQTGSVVDGTFHWAIQIFWILLVAVTLAPYLIPAFAQTINDPFPTPIAAVEGVINVDFVEFASIPDIDGQAARVMLLVDEPGTLYSVSYDGQSVTQYVSVNADNWGVSIKSSGRERGMQSFAFHPLFAQAGTPGFGKFYIWTARTPGAANGLEPEFETEVWPILETHCMECHGEQQTYSNLRLDSPTAIRRGGELGEVLVPGDPEGSEIYRRTALPPDDLDFMPVDNEPLNEEELERLRDWIAAGADFGTWSGP